MHILFVFGTGHRHASGESAGLILGMSVVVGEVKSENLFERIIRSHALYLASLYHIRKTNTVEIFLKLGLIIRYRTIQSKYLILKYMVINWIRDSLYEIQ
jgi:hypothetical protein